MRPRITIAKLLFALVLIAALVAVAAPLLPTESKLPFAVRSLAGLDRIEVRIRPWKQVPVKVDLTATTLQAAWEGTLKRAGFKLGRGSDVPKLDLNVRVITDSDVPDGVSVHAMLTLKQNVLVKRLDKELLLPTWTGVYTQMTPKSEFGIELQGMMDQLIGEFIHRTQTATRHQK